MPWFISARRITQRWITPEQMLPTGHASRALAEAYLVARAAEWPPYDEHHRFLIVEAESLADAFEQVRGIDFNDQLAPMFRHPV